MPAQVPYRLLQQMNLLLLTVVIQPLYALIS